MKIFFGLPFPSGARRLSGRYLQGVLGALLLIFGSISPVFAQTPESGAPDLSTPRSAISREPTFAADGEVNLSNTYGGPVFAIGGQVDFNGTALQDLVVAGGTIRVSGTVEQDVYAAGGSVIISGTVHGNIIAAGGEVQILPSAQVVGSVLAAGERLQVRSYLQESAWLSGKNLFILQGSKGNLNLVGESLVLAPTASVAGNLTVQAGEDGLDDQASVAGQRDIRFAAVDAPEGFLSIFSQFLSDLAWRAVFLGTLLWLLPSTLKKGTEQLTSTLLSSASSGMILLAGIPLLVLLLFVTVIGIPLAGFLGLLYLAAVLLSWVFPTLALGERLMPRKSQWLQAGVALIVVSVIGLFPVIGVLLNIALMVVGTGALWSLMRQSRIQISSKK